MSIQKFSKNEAIKFGWSQMKSNLKFFIGLLLFVWVINIVLSYVRYGLEKIDLLFIVIVVGSSILGIIFSLGMIKIALDFAGGVKGKFSDLFSQYRLFLEYLIAKILYLIIVVAGLILFIIPGIIWGIKFQYFPYLIVDKGMGPIEALKESSRITAGSKWNLFLFGLLLGLINIAGALAFGVGLFVTVPTSMVAMAFVYRKLLVTGNESIQEKD